MSKRCLGCMELFGEEFEICPHCGYIVGTSPEEATHIEPGSLLYDRYIIGKAYAENSSRARKYPTRRPLTGLRSPYISRLPPKSIFQDS